jgi:hypothetical protein
METLSPFMPVDYVQLSVFETITGYSPDAVQKKIKRGEWREGLVWRRAPDGRILVSLRGYHR